MQNDSLKKKLGVANAAPLCGDRETALQVSSTQGFYRSKTFLLIKVKLSITFAFAFIDIF